MENSSVAEPTPDPLGGDHRNGPWQRTGAVGERGLAHPDTPTEECFN